MSKPPPTLSQLFLNWRNLPWQRAAVAELDDDIRQNGYDVAMTRERPWYSTWQHAAGEVHQRLKVPYFSQNDNASGTGYRECFSSSCAMVAAYWGKVSSDDQYNQIRARYGDTTDAQAQIEALRAMGLQARLVTNCTAAILAAELDAGRPVPVGWLHKAGINAPSGGGHWSVVIGSTPDGWVHNDPNGEADLVGGGYVRHDGGNGVIYSRQNWGRRWEADGPGTGWALLVTSPTAPGR